MLLRLKEELGSMTNAFDIIYVLEGNKPGARIMYHGNKRILRLLKDMGLDYALSDYKVLKHTDKTRNYSDKGIKAARQDRREGSFFLYVSRGREWAEEAKNAEAGGNDILLGKLLGYPECCVEFFEKHKKEAAETTNDFTVFTFRESSGIVFPWQNNFCLRGFDISLISHFPCSFKCGASRKTAESNFEVIEKYGHDVPAYFSSALKCGIMYAQGVGVYCFPGIKIEGRDLLYNPNQVIASNRNELYGLIRKRDKITLLGRGHFRIRDIEIEDDHTFFGLFS
ncbi:DUF483 domain-containing protein [Candidatus Woesearchaeota archaeon]|nr:DUF483 domain-containing protein [Candidatus Woesearchaeota archaeon]